MIVAPRTTIARTFPARPGRPAAPFGAAAAFLLVLRAAAAPAQEDAPAPPAADPAAGQVAPGAETSVTAPADEAALSGQELAALSYEREFFYYEGAGRRDPFEPLLDVDLEAGGPRFDELVLTGLFLGEGGGMVVVEDAQRRGYFLKLGDVVGKATLVDIQPDVAVFELREFGISRRESLQLERREGT